MRNRLLYTALSIMVVLVTLVVSACGEEATPTVDPNQLATEVAQQVFGTMTAEALLAPTDTPAATPTATPTLSPTPTRTRRPTSTPTKRPPTRTPKPTSTPTPQPAVGDTVRCDGMWEITVSGLPSFAKRLDQLDTQGYPSISNDDAAKGEWLLVFFFLSNIGSETDRLSSFGDELVVQGKLNDRWVTFAPSTWGTSYAGEKAGLSDWTDEVPPGITITAPAFFDVNPDAEEWTLILQPGGASSPDCYVAIRLDQVTESYAMAMVTKQVKVRTGPGAAYPAVATVQVGQRLAIVGRNKDASWWQVTYQSKTVWLPASNVTTSGPADSVPEITDIAPPPATRAPTATPTPLPMVQSDQEVVVGIWGMRFYDVKKTKAVYWFGEAEIAQGIWLIPLVEFRNAGSGTAYPSHNLDFYLQDDRGRKYEFDPFGDAVLGAAWQFQAGHLYDDVNPGITLGIALPFDVPPDMGHAWLRLEQDASFAMYIGNVSQLPEVE